MTEPAPEDVHTLSQLSQVSVDAVSSILRDRFYSSHSYTNVSPSILISVNPYSSAGNQNSDVTLREYTRDYRQTAKANRLKLSPHVFQTACDAYYYMMRTGQDQSILFA
jgi:chitin synthase